jgi:ring-1,2-phenylacetyl-CoA epoxidase subunit PaaD
VSATFEIPWTSERISEAGRAALLAAGIAPPASDAGGTVGAGGLIDLEPRVPCPHCGSRRTTLENLFGPTQCRTIRYCADCRQPFESIKPV